MAEDAGADSLLIVTPPYNKPSTNGLLNHFESIAKAVNIPLCLYHVPGRTAQMLTVSQIEQLCNIENVVAVKEASADIGFFSRCKNTAKAEFLTGDDPTYLASLSVGGIGAISVVSNVFPEAMVSMTNAFKKGDHKLALEYHSALLPFIDILFCEANPGPTKAAFKMLGYGSDFVRAPLALMEGENLSRVEMVLAETKAKLDGIR